MTSYEIVGYGPHLKDEVAQLQRHLWSPDSGLNRRYLEWKYERNPYFPEAHIYLARSGGRIVGMRGAVGTAWQVGTASEVVLVPSPDDFVVAPEHRNSGVAALIMQAVFADLTAGGFEHVFSLSSGRVAALSSLATGWKSAGAMEPVARLSRRRRIRADLEHQKLFWRLAPLLGDGVTSRRSFVRLDRAGHRLEARPGGTISVERTPRPEAMAALIQRLDYDGRIRHVRDAAYFAWRFQNPLHEYRFLVFESAERLEGYLVLRRYVSESAQASRTHIVDWEASSASVRNELLQVAIAHAGFAELGAWTGTLDEDSRRTLIQSGFEPAEPTLRARGFPCVLVRPLGQADWTLHGRRLLDPGQWDVRLLFSMRG
ncbi:MAG TPA: GNAT family N-acetyltransferase [Gemmatimonadales bacterium]